MLHAAVEKLTTWISHVIEGSASKRSKQYDPHDSPPGERGVNTKSSRPDGNEHIPQSQSLHSLEQARCCLKRFRLQATRQIHILPSTLDLNTTLVYPGFDLAVAASVCTIQVPRRSHLIGPLLSNRSNHSRSVITQGTH